MGFSIRLNEGEAPWVVLSGGPQRRGGRLFEVLKNGDLYIAADHDVLDYRPGVFIRPTLPALDAQPLDAPKSSGEATEGSPRSAVIGHLHHAQQRLERVLRVAQHPASQDRTTSSVLASWLAEELSEVAEGLTSLSNRIHSQLAKESDEPIQCIQHLQDSSEDIPF